MSAHTVLWPAWCGEENVDHCAAARDLWAWCREGGDLSCHLLHLACNHSSGPAVSPLLAYLWHKCGIPQKLNSTSAVGFNTAHGLPLLGQVRVETHPWKIALPSSNIEVELTTVSSNYHVEMNPSDVGNRDRHIVQEVIKVCSSFSVCFTAACTLTGELCAFFRPACMTRQRHTGFLCCCATRLVPAS